MGKKRSLSAGLPIPGLDPGVEDQAAPAGGQVELVAVLNLAPALDDDVGVRLEQADDLLVGGESLAMKNATLALRDDALDQRAKAAELGLPSMTAIGSSACDPWVAASSHGPRSPGSA
jgi:hypothetical protein